MVAVAGVIVTEATGTGVTVIVEGPLFPSLVAVIVAVPAALPVTSPLAVTVATAVLLLPQLTVRPDNGLPLASFGVAVSCTVWPTCTDAVLGLTVTDATGTVLTVTVAVPLCPSLVAVIVAAPAVTPVTSPPALTVATAVLLLPQLAGRPDNGLPLASCELAGSCTVWPTCTDAVPGLTVPDSTGTVLTVIAAVPLCPSLVAVIVAAPAVTPVTTPLPLTVATAVLLLPQLTGRPDNGLPLASFGVAVSCTVWPTCTDAVLGLTVTDATGTVLTVTVAGPLCPSLVAVIVAAPAVTPVTSPPALTVATAVLLLPQLTGRPDNGLPLASFEVAVSCTVWPTCTDAVPGLTVTDATGTVLTVIVAVPLCPSLVAVIVAAPAVTPVTTPLPLTVATAVLLRPQLTGRPDNGLPLASFGVAVSCTVWPTGTDAVLGLTVTDATGTVLTVIVAVPLCPSLVAVIVAAPAVTPVTTPLPLTVATAVLLLPQLTGRPDNGLPLASFEVAVSCTVWPTCTDAVPGLTVTDATGTVLTVIVAVPLCPSQVAVIVAAPAATPVTNPLALTVATAVLPLAQVIVRPESELPFASFGAAASCIVWPTCTVAVAGLTVTDATGTVVTVIAAVPLCPSLVAVIVAAPAVTPVTTPLPLTVATAVLLLPQLTGRPDNGLT